MPFVCVQPMQTSWARRSEDLTFDKTDDKDAMLIARLTAQLRCYVPEPVEETWGRLRHLGTRRERLIGEAVAQVQQMRDLLECVWPAALDTANYPFRSRTWAAAMWVVVDRDNADFTRTRRLGLARFETAVRREITKRGGHRPCLRIVRKLFAALTDPTGVIAHRRGALERVQLLLEDWAENQRKLADTEARMTAVLDELELTALVTSISGISAVGAAAILAETGDLLGSRRHAPWSSTPASPPGRSSRAPSPAAPSSPAKAGPELRLAAWRAVWGALQTNTVYAARYRHLTTRETNKLTPTQAQTVIAAAILRHMHAVITSGVAWDPVIATHGTRHHAANTNGRLTQLRRPLKQTVGASPTRH